MDKFIMYLAIMAMLSGKTSNSPGKTLIKLDCAVKIAGCLDTISVVADSSCRFMVTPAMVAKGDCLDHPSLSVIVFDHAVHNGSIADGPGSFPYQLIKRGLVDSVLCSGIIKVEDKTPPRIICPANVDSILLSPVSLMAHASVRTTGKPDGQFCLTQEASNTNFVDTFSFKPNKTGLYVFHLLSKDSKARFGIFSYPGQEPSCHYLLGTSTTQSSFLWPEYANYPFAQTIVLPLAQQEKYSIWITTSFATGVILLVESDLEKITTCSPGRLSFEEKPILVKAPLTCMDKDTLKMDRGEPLDPWEISRYHISDNCSGTKLNIAEVEETTLNRLKRTFTATDHAGNVSFCNQYIGFRNLSLNDVFAPPMNVYLDCSYTFPVDSAGAPSPLAGGSPLIITGVTRLALSGKTCNISAAYEDQIIRGDCDGNYQILRQWKILDWNTRHTRSFDQLIHIGDFSAPEFVNFQTKGVQSHGDTLIVPIDPYSCVANFLLPMPVIYDKCSSLEILADIHLKAPGGALGEKVHSQVISGNGNRLVSELPLQEYWIVYTAHDACGNSNNWKFILNLIDDASPVAACNEQLTVSLTGEGFAGITASEVDEGSWDNCTLKELEIRRDSLPWGDTIVFDCSDLGKKVPYELKATDMQGNFSVCRGVALVEDKIKPKCLPAHYKEITCDEIQHIDLYDTLALNNQFERANSSDNCFSWIKEYPPVVDLDGCGVGQVIRKFVALDSSGNQSDTCYQRIKIARTYHYSIKFPKDTISYCEYPDADTVEVFEGTCDLLTIRVKDAFYEVSNHASYKILRTYEVVNWCEYDGFSDPVVISRDEDCDGVVGEEDVWVIRGSDTTFIDKDHNPYNRIPALGSRARSCPPANPEGYWRQAESKGYWQYTQVLLVQDTIPPTVTYTELDPICTVDNVDCDEPVEYPVIIRDNCTFEDIDVEIKLDLYRDDSIDEDISQKIVVIGRYPKYVLRGEYPVGKHFFVVRVTDGCGNTTIEKMPFEVVDCKAPNPKCLSGLAVELMPVQPGTDADADGDEDTGAMTLWAADFLIDSIVDCSPPLFYSINRKGEIPDKDKSSIVLTCDDPAQLDLEIYAWDSYFNYEAIQPDGSPGGRNYDHCAVRILVQDNLFGQCGRDSLVSSVSGIVSDPNGTPLPGAGIRMTGTPSKQVVTLEDGNYTVQGLIAGRDYTFAASRDNDHNLGVSTYDLILISRHILGVDLLDSPYQLIAADVNRSGTITALDLIQLRRLILHTILAFEGNTSWRFVPAGYIFSDPANPWLGNFPEVINVNDFDPLHNPNLDFIAIKVGDVNIDGLNGPAQSRAHHKPVQFTMVPLPAQSDQTLGLTFLPAEVMNLAGFQFALDFDAASFSFAGYHSNLLTDDNIGFQEQGTGRLFFSWNTPTPRAKLSPDAPVFTLYFLPKKNGISTLTPTLLPAKIMKAEAYIFSPQPTILPLDLVHAPDTASAIPILFQNTPNPFQSNTKIRFFLPQPEFTTLKIFNQQGALIYDKKDYYPAGFQEIILQNIPMGMFIFTLQGSNFFMTKKMLSL